MPETTWTRDAVKELMAKVLGERLGMSAESVSLCRDLSTLPGFNSFVAAECLEHVEDVTAVDADPERMSKDTFRNVDRMAEVFDVG